jgi:hypothetical protein
MMVTSPQRKIAGYERRPIVVLRKRKLSLVLNAWYMLSDERRRRRMRFERAAKHFMNQQLGKVGWAMLHVLLVMIQLKRSGRAGCTTV